MKSNTTGNYTIAIEGTFEVIELQKVNETLRTQTIKLIGQRIDLRAGIYKAMVADKSFAELVCDAAAYFNLNNPRELTYTPNPITATKKKVKKIK